MLASSERRNIASMISCLVKIQNLGIIWVVLNSSATVFLWFLYGSKIIKVKAFLWSILGDLPGDPLCEGIECDHEDATAFRTRIQSH